MGLSKGKNILREEDEGEPSYDPLEKVGELKKVNILSRFTKNF